MRSELARGRIYRCARKESMDAKALVDGPPGKLFQGTLDSLAILHVPNDNADPGINYANEKSP
jgi:hypothetical protein